jgi:hypothetical protein
MNSLRQIWMVSTYNFRTWGKNPRVFITFALAFVLCFLLGQQVGAFSREFKTTVQLVESFCWIFGDGTSILLASLLLVLLFGDMPFLGSGAPFYLVRIRRSTWLTGQVLYVFLATAAFMLFLLLSTVALSATNAFTANVWSDTAAMLGFSPAGQSTELPVMIKTLELSTPYVCMAQIFALMLLYTLASAMLMLVLNLKKGPAWGIAGLFTFNLFGFLLKPKTIETLLGWQAGYRTNLIAAWMSPLQHATYSMHNFGFDSLPRLWQSWVFFAAVALILLFFSRRAIRRYNFNFTGGQD